MKTNIKLNGLVLTNLMPFNFEARNSLSDSSLDNPAMIIQE